VVNPFFHTFGYKGISLPHGGARVPEPVFDATK